MKHRLRKRYGTAKGAAGLRRAYRALHKLEDQITKAIDNVPFNENVWENPKVRALMQQLEALRDSIARRLPR